MNAALLTRAIEQAVKRATVLPVVDGRLLLEVEIRHYDTDGQYHPQPSGDYDGRVMLVVRDGAGNIIDSFFGREHVDALTPFTPMDPR